MFYFGKERSFMKIKTKYLVAILFMLVGFLTIGATNVNAETRSVTKCCIYKSRCWCC